MSGREMLQTAPHSFLSGAADHPAAGTFPVLTGAVGEVDDVGDLGKPIALDLLAPVQGKSPQGPAMESPVEADSVAVVLFVVVADFDGVLDGLGAGVGKESGPETELGGDLHELVVKVGRGGDLRFFRIRPPGADEIAPGVAVRIDSLKHRSDPDELRVVVAQGRPGHMGDKIENDIPIHVRAEGADGRPGPVPDEPFVIGGAGSIFSMKIRPSAGIGAGGGVLMTTRQYLGSIRTPFLYRK